MMSRLSPRVAAPFAGIALLAGCAPTFEARVARFNMLPPAAGQSFAIAPRGPTEQNSLEFETYAALVRANLKNNGFAEAANPADATMMVRFDYQLGAPREIIQATPGSAWAGGWGGPGWGWGGRGWNPYWGAWGGGWGGGWAMQPQITTITQFPAQVAMKIERKPDKASVFEGRAETVSTSSNLTQLVPNLIHAMFAQWPGVSGQSVRVRFNPNDPANTTTVTPTTR
jgi:ribosomal protein L35AE/L33A